MAEILLVVHLLVALVLIGAVLLQRSEGGALGIGGGGGGGPIFSGRGTANFLTRGTALLAVAFFITSISLAILARGTSEPGSVFDTIQSTDPQGGTSQPLDESPVRLPQLPGSLPTDDN